jgi:hypothetical protein
MSHPPVSVGIDGAQAHWEVALRPSAERRTVPNQEADIAALVPSL